MNKSPTFIAALLLSTAVVFAGSEPQHGTIVSQTSVACGAKKSKSQDIDLLCQQYVVRSGTTDYTIRQPKPSDQSLIPLNTSIQFTLDKNKMKFKANGKSFEFIVVSQAAASSTSQPPVARAAPFRFGANFGGNRVYHNAEGIFHCPSIDRLFLQGRRQTS